MKNKLIVLTICSLFISMSATAVVPAKQATVVTAKTLVVLGSSLTLKEEKQNKTQYLAEYIPASETFDNYTKMFAMWGQLDGSKPIEQVKAKVQFVNSRKGKDPMANFKLYENDNKKAYGLDFLISEAGIIEHNVWYFTEVKGGVLAYQYARRYYQGKSTTNEADFLREIPKATSDALSFFKNTALPKPPGYK